MHNKSSPTRRQKVIALAVVVVGVVLVVAGVLSRRSQAVALKDSATAAAVPTVALLSANQIANGTLELPARIEPWSRAPIYARVSGYLKSWNVDIGGKVKAGQTLADIETPDLDQQLLQAKAELATARSNMTLATSTAKRWQSLLKEDAVSRQEADEKVGDLSAKQSAVNAMQANVDRVQALQRYTRLVAPFDGVVTARNTDVGALINVGGGQGSELFVVSDISRLRVYVNVPQRQLAGIKQGATAQLTVPERPGQTYSATVQSMAQSISAGSGTMLVQLAVKNEGAQLLPGAYANVRFATPAAAGALSVPPGALIFNKAGTQVATVDAQNHVQLKPVTVARDLGSVIELAGGITAADRVIANPPDGIASGELVRVAETKKAAP